MKYNVLDVDDEIKKNKKYLTKITSVVVML